MGETLRTALERLDADEPMTGATLGALRQAMYADGSIDADEVRTLLRLHRAGRGEEPGWADFFVEALADYFALQREAPPPGTTHRPDFARALANVLRTLSPSPGHKTGGVGFDEPPVPEVAGEIGALMDAFAAEGGLALDAVERRALARLFDRVVVYPDALKAFALEAVYESVRADGVIDAEEVAFLRRVLYGPAGDAGIVISREEAEVLCALRATARPEDCAPEWPELFAKAVGCHVLVSGAAPDVVDEADAAWLADRLGSPEALDVAGRRLLIHLAREAREVAPSFERYAQAA